MLLIKDLYLAKKCMDDESANDLNRSWLTDYRPQMSSHSLSLLSAA